MIPRGVEHRDALAATVEDIDDACHQRSSLSHYRLTWLEEDLEPIATPYFSGLRGQLFSSLRFCEVAAADVQPSDVLEQRLQPALQPCQRIDQWQETG